MELPVMKKGKYECLYRLNVYERAGLGANKRTVLEANSEIEIIESKYLKASVWGKMKEGWVCMYMNQTQYLRKIAK